MSLVEYTEASSSGHDSPMSVSRSFASLLRTTACRCVHFSLVWIEHCLHGVFPLPFVAVAFLYPALFHFVDIFCSLSFILPDSVMAFICANLLLISLLFRLCLAWTSFFPLSTLGAPVAKRGRDIFFLFMSWTIHGAIPSGCLC